jgi:septum site-determining protein MinD
MGVSVSLASGKGGVGTSTIAANLGIVLSKIGITSLTLDGDIEGASLGMIMGVDPGVPSIHDCLSNKIKCEEAIIEAHGTNIIVGGIKIEQLVDVSLETFPNILDDLSEKFDIVLVDSPAGIGNHAITVISSCQSIILVLTPDISSVTGVLKTLAVSKKVGTTILGAVVNKTGGRYDIPSDKIADLLKVNVIAEIRSEESVAQSLNEALPIVVGNPSSEFSSKMEEVANKLIGGS